MNLMSNGLWNLSSPVWLAIIIATVIYGLRFASDRRRAIAFAAAMFFLAMAFLAPLGVLSDGYLFSAHMTQHLLLLLIIPLFIQSMRYRQHHSKYVIRHGICMRTTTVSKHYV